MEEKIETIKADGVNFMIDNEGNKVAVLINLEKHGDLLEDFFDIIISRQRIQEDKKISFSDFKQTLIDDEKIVTDV